MIIFFNIRYHFIFLQFAIHFVLCFSFFSFRTKLFSTKVTKCVSFGDADSMWDYSTVANVQRIISVHGMVQITFRFLRVLRGKRTRIRLECDLNVFLFSVLKKYKSFVVVKEVTKDTKEHSLHVHSNPVLKWSSSDGCSNGSSNESYQRVDSGTYQPRM